MPASAMRRARLAAPQAAARARSAAGRGCSPPRHHSGAAAHPAARHSARTPLARALLRLPFDRLRIDVDSIDVRAPSFAAAIARIRSRSRSRARSRRRAAPFEQIAASAGWSDGCRCRRRGPDRCAPPAPRRRAGASSARSRGARRSSSGENCAWLVRIQSSSVERLDAETRVSNDSLPRSSACGERALRDPARRASIARSATASLLRPPGHRLRAGLRAAPRSAPRPAPGRPPGAGAARASLLLRLLLRQLLLEIVDRHAAAHEARVVQELRCSGMLVWMPSTTISESAMRMRAIACSRVVAVGDHLADHRVVVRAARYSPGRRANRRGCRGRRAGGRR